MKLPKTIVAATLFAGVAMTANAEGTGKVTLNGTITNSTCDISLNGGAAVLDVGTYRSGDFVAGQQLGSVPLSVSMTNCTDGESGYLKVSGNTATGNTQIFTENDGDTVGFMMKYGGTTVTEGGDTASVTISGTEAQKEFLVGMASVAAAPDAGNYTAPVTVNYIVE
ncbi:hypothetical protein A3Q29_20120 [Providencia stuartii]|uniref:Fimbrial protein n=1 Tax=Providencia stuartii TaxID=588 RepID=A0A1S1HQN4_PROST|nr:hypothetical protein A3Q29_20120 [Providencia stuartii]